MGSNSHSFILFGRLVLLSLLILFVSLIYQSFSTLSRQSHIVTPLFSVEHSCLNRLNSSATRLSQAIKIPTISFEDRKSINYELYQEIHRLIEVSFPLVHQQLVKEDVGGYSLLYTWKGRNFQTGKDSPFMLCGHLDVVPVASETLSNWTFPPFEGVIADGYLWGRGTMDDKQTVFGILEAVETLLCHGFQPENSVYLAFGHDEEISGYYGAKTIGKVLRDRNLTMEFIIDEGMPIVKGMIDGLPPSQEVGLIGIGEKGWTEIELV